MVATRPIQIAVLVPITSTGFRGDALSEAFAGRPFTVTSYFLQSGPVSVESAVDEILAGPGMIAAAIKAEAAGAEALVIDCMLDPALDALRETVSIPVLGCGEVSMTQVAEQAGDFSIVTVLDRQDRLFRDKARLYGYEDRLKSVRSIDIPVLELTHDTATTLAATLEQSCLAVETNGAKAIVFGCTGMMGLGAGVKSGLMDAGHDVPVIDPLPFTVTRACERVQSGASHSKDNYPYPERKGFQGLSDWPELHALLDPLGDA